MNFERWTNKVNTLDILQMLIILYITSNYGSIEYPPPIKKNCDMFLE